MTDNAKLDLILEKITNVDDKVTGLESKVTGLESKVTGLDEKVTGLDEKVTGLDEKVTGLETDLKDVKHKVNGLETDLKDVKHKVNELNLTVENEIRVNIQRVAEGHLDLYRNLKDCINLSSEVKARQEMQDIYINIHDTQLKSLERQRA